MSSHSRNPHDPWARLTAAARTVRDDREASAPYGFATRVAALAFEQERRLVSLFDRFALRALGLACLLALVSIAINYQALNSPASVHGTGDEVIVAVDDPVAVVLDFAD